MVQLRFCVLGNLAGSVLRASTTWTCVAGRAGRKGAGWECGGARSFSSAAVTMAPIKVTGFTFPGSNLSRLFGFHTGSRSVLLDVSSCHAFCKTLSLPLRPGTFLEPLSQTYYATARDHFQATECCVISHIFEISLLPLGRFSNPLYPSPKPQPFPCCTRLRLIFCKSCGSLETGVCLSHFCLHSVNASPPHFCLVFLGILERIPSPVLGLHF